MGVFGEACIGFVRGVGGDQPEPGRLGVGQDLDPLDHEAGAVPQHRRLAGAGRAAGHVDQQPVAVGDQRLHGVAPRAQDTEITGFGVRVYPSGGKVFVAQTRGPDGPNKPNKPRRITVGRHPVLSAEQARQRAALIIARVKAGEDPVPLPLPAKYAGGPTVTDLANRYLEEHVAVRCKPKTQRTARSVVNRHIVPALGKLPIAAVERRHVMALHESLCETPAMANMAVETLRHMYVLARGWDMAPEDCDDPCEFIPMNPKRRRERFLTDAEFTRLGQVLDEASGKRSRISAGAIATIRLLMLTGCRRNEILTLRWEHVDLDAAEINLADGKTGARTIHLSPSAVRVLTDLPRKPGNPWVIPGAKPSTHMTDIDGAWETIRARAELHDVRIHDIRHTCAFLPYSLAA